MAGHANSGGVTNIRVGRETGCPCCQHFSTSTAKVRTRRVARRAAKAKLRNLVY